MGPYVYEALPLGILLAGVAVGLAELVSIKIRRPKSAFHLVMCLPLVSFFFFVLLYTVDALGSWLFWFSIDFNIPPLFDATNLLLSSIFMLQELLFLPTNFMYWLTVISSGLATFVLVMFIATRKVFSKEHANVKHVAIIFVALLLESLPFVYSVTALGFSQSFYLIFLGPVVPPRPPMHFLLSGIAALGAILFASEANRYQMLFENVISANSRELALVTCSLSMGYYSGILYDWGLIRSLEFNVVSVAFPLILILSALSMLVHRNFGSPLVKKDLPKVLVLPTTLITSFVILVHMRLPSYAVEPTILTAVMIATIFAASTSFLLAYLFGASLCWICLRLRKIFQWILRKAVLLKRYLQLEDKSIKFNHIKGPSKALRASSFQFLCYCFVEILFASGWIIVFFIEEMRTLTLSTTGLPTEPLAKLQWNYFRYFLADVYAVAPHPIGLFMNDIVFAHLVIPLVLVPIFVVTCLSLAEIGGITLNGRFLTPKLLHKLLALTIMSSFIAKMTLLGGYGAPYTISISLTLLSIVIAGIALSITTMRKYIDLSLKA